MLNRDEIKRRGIIVSAIPANYDRAASYDLRIGKILAIKPEGRSEPIETDRIGCLRKEWWR